MKSDTRYHQIDRSEDGSDNIQNSQGVLTFSLFLFFLFFFFFFLVADEINAAVAAAAAAWFCYIQFV